MTEDIRAFRREKERLSDGPGRKGRGRVSVSREAVERMMERSIERAKRKEWER